MKKYLSLLLFFSVLLINITCRKNDKSLLQPFKEDNITTSFFETHRSFSQLENAIVEFIKRNNDKFSFVSQTVKQIGYPWWNRMKVFENTVSPKSNASRTFMEENETDTSTVVYVPFVKPGKDRVNSVLMFRMNQTDTTFQYVSNWQYSSFSFADTSSSVWSAQDILHIFMTMDNEVFGYDEFQVMDGRLLGNPNAVGTLHLLPDSSAYRSGKSLTEVVASFTFCHWISSCICVGATQKASTVQRISEDDPPSSSLPCNGPCSYTGLCTTIWIDLGTGGTSGGGGSGGTGGPTGGSGGSSGTGGHGGTGTGGWIPPACSRCNVGWTPGGGGVSSINPCDKVSPLLTDLTFQARVANSQNLLTGNQEYAFSITSVGEGYHSDLGIAGECEVKSPFNANTPELRLYTHMHTNSCPLPVFSPEDLSQLDQIISLDAASSNFVFALITDAGIYFIVIDNPTAFDQFARKWLRYDSPKDMDDLNDKYIEYDINRQNSAAENEKRFLQFLKDSSPGTSSGLKLLKANADLSGLKQLSLDENNQLIPTPCN